MLEGNEQFVLQWGQDFVPFSEQVLYFRDTKI